MCAPEERRLREPSRAQHTTNYALKYRQDRFIYTAG